MISKKEITIWKYNILQCGEFFLGGGGEALTGSTEAVHFSNFQFSFLWKFHIFLFHFLVSKSRVPRTGSNSGSATENVLFVPLHCSYEWPKIVLDYLCNDIFKFFCIYLACFFGRVFPTCGWRVAWPAPALSPPPAVPVSPSPTLRNRGALTRIFGHHFNKRPESFAPCYSRPFYWRILKKPYSSLVLKILTKNRETRKI